MDQDIAQYRIFIRGKKWYWSIFTWFLDATLHNSWIIHKQASGSKLTKREFRRDTYKFTETKNIRKVLQCKIQ